MRPLSPTDIISRAASAVPEHARRTRKMREEAVERAALRQTPLPLPMPTSRTGMRVAGRVRPAPRRRLTPILTRRRALWLAALLVLIGGPTWLATAGHLDPLGAAAHRQTIAVSRGLGLTVSEVLVEGRERTSQKELRDALDRQPRCRHPRRRSGGGAHAARGPALGPRRRGRAPPARRHLCPAHRAPADRAHPRQGQSRPGRPRRPGPAHRRRRQLRQAAARRRRRRRGQRAAAHRPARRTAGARQARSPSRARIGDRRWDLAFDSGVVLRLPEELPSLAWARFAEIEKLHRLLDRGLVAIDLRLKDRIGLRHPDAASRSPRSSRARAHEEDNDHDQRRHPPHGRALNEERGNSGLGKVALGHDRRA